MHRLLASKQVCSQPSRQAPAHDLHATWRNRSIELMGSSLTSGLRCLHGYSSVALAGSVVRIIVQNRFNTYDFGGAKVRPTAAPSLLPGPLGAICGVCLPSGSFIAVSIRCMPCKPMFRKASDASMEAS